MKRLFILTFFLSGISLHSFAQNFKDDFYKILENKQDSLQQKKYLDNWEYANPNDPELYVAYYNYYVRRSSMELLTIDKNPNSDESIKISGSDSSNKGEVGFINNGTYYNPNFLNKGFEYIDKGIKLFPNRLDMRFGKIYLLGETKDYKSFTNEIVKTIEYSDKNKNKWTWSDDKATEDDPEKFMLGSVQTYVLQIYDTGDDALLVYMKKIAETVLKYYPDNVENLSNLSIVYLINKEYDRALKPLLKAEKIAPEDFIVLSNIAQAYLRKGDTDNAIKYYELTLKYGDEEAKEYAREELAKLKKK